MKVGFAQNSVKGTQEKQFKLLEKQVAQAKKDGAEVFCTQELFLTPYFCNLQDPANFDFALEIPGVITERLQSLAAMFEIVLVASLFEKQAEGLFYNTAVVIDADGAYLGKYRKSHIPQDPGFEEKFYFTPGDSNYPVFKTQAGTIGVLICWDQWYPEAARLIAMAGAEVIFYPTAIGWLPEEKAELGVAQHHAWQTVMQGHAVANGCYVVAVNRVGTEAGTEFWGQSFVANPYGELICRASECEEEVYVVDCDREKAKEFRRIWPFFRDRRIDQYSDITKRWREES